eukprot:691190_1
MDVIIVYHPIYHFQLQILSQTIHSIVSSLKPDGVCIISLLDDTDKFAKIYPKLSPQYKLSTNVEQILKTIPGIYYKKEFETSEYNTDWNGHLKLLMDVPSRLHESKLFPKWFKQRAVGCCRHRMRTIY